MREQTYRYRVPTLRALLVVWVVAAGAVVTLSLTALTAAVCYRQLVGLERTLEALPPPQASDSAGSAQGARMRSVVTGLRAAALVLVIGAAGLSVVCGLLVVRVYRFASSWSRDGFWADHEGCSLPTWRGSEARVLYRDLTAVTARAGAGGESSDGLVLSALNSRYVVPAWCPGSGRIVDELVMRASLSAGPPRRGFVTYVRSPHNG